MRSSFGFTGQVNRRVHASRPTSVKDKFSGKLVELTNLLNIGDPTRRDVYLEAVINANAYREFGEFTENWQRRIVSPAASRCAAANWARVSSAPPPLPTACSATHRLWKREMFVPIDDHGSRFTGRRDAIANDVDYGPCRILRKQKRPTGSLRTFKPV